MGESLRTATADRTGADDARRAEAGKLIDMAKRMLTEPAEEIAAIYLDHALDALQAIPAETSPGLIGAPL